MPADTVDRGPLGKADAPGSCVTDDADDFCAGKRDGACWCDDPCASFGDCCDDKRPLCDGVDPRPVLCMSDDACEASCGCTRNWVARTDADTGEWSELRDAAFANGCSLPGGISACDCPAADGFVCDAGTCAWNYL